MIHSGATIGAQARIEEHAVVGMPELGRSAGLICPKPGSGTTIGAGVVVRSGAVIYADVRIEANSLVGHGTLLRSGVRIGTDTQLGHQLTIERAARIGDQVRCSPGSYLTGFTVLADRVLLGAGVRTISAKKRAQPDAVGSAPTFGTGAQVGSASVLLAGVTMVSMPW